MKTNETEQELQSWRDEIEARRSDGEQSTRVSLVALERLLGVTQHLANLVHDLREESGYDQGFEAGQEAERKECAWIAEQEDQHAGLVSDRIFRETGQWESTLQPQGAVGAARRIRDAIRARSSQSESSLPTP